METEMHPAWVLNDEERETIARQVVVVTRLHNGDRDFTMGERQDMKMAAAICRGLGGEDDLWTANFLQGILDKMVVVAVT